MKGAKRGKYVVILSVFLILMTISFVSAGFFSDLFKKDPALGPVDVNVIVSAGDAPIIFQISPIQNVVLNPGDAITFTEVTTRIIGLPAVTTSLTDQDPPNGEYLFIMRVSDVNGRDNIEDTTASVTLSRGGESRSTGPGDCTVIPALSPSSGDVAVYECVIDMFWYDSPGTLTLLPQWDISANIADAQGTPGTQDYRDTIVDKFNVQRNEGIVAIPTLSPFTAITFPTLNPGDFNQPSNNDPLILTNTGNVNPLSVDVQGRDLVGTGANTDTILSELFGIGVVDGAIETDIGACDLTDALNTAQLAVDGGSPGYVSISGLAGFALLKGDFVNLAGFERDMYVCLDTVVVSLTPDSYSTTNLGGSSWDVRMNF